MIGTDNTARVLDDRASVNRIASLQKHLTLRNDALLEHRYFGMCERGEISRSRMIEVVKQLYCFSVFFERILTRRIAEYSSRMDSRIIRISREHLREEIGHADLFHDCLVANGMSPDEIARINPKMFTKAMFGYLVATVQHENEYVSNVAIMQVMETIGYHFFRSTLEVMRAHGMSSVAFVQHADDDEGHSALGLELAAFFDDRTFADVRRVVDDLYRLMGFVLDEWLGESDPHGAS